MKETLRKIMNAIDNSELKGAKSTLTELEGVIEQILEVDDRGRPKSTSKRSCCHSNEATAHRVDCPKWVCTPKSTQPENRHAAKNLERALETFKTRNKAYGDNYKFFGNVMQPLFPQGVHLETAQQWNRFGIIVQIMSKLTRYAWHGDRHGHLDSIHDIIPYAAMLEEIDAEIAGLRVVQPRDDEQQLLDLQESCQHVWKADIASPDGKPLHCIVPGCGAVQP